MTTIPQPSAFPNAFPGTVYVAPDIAPRKRIDWGQAFDGFLLGVASAITFGVGNWSIATVVHDAGAPVAVAVGAAAAFDFVAVAAAVRVHRLRLTPHRAFAPLLIMVVAVIVSMVVNAAHGYAMGGWMVGAVLGAVPLVFETVWCMNHGIRPWSVRRHFKDEVAAMNRRDVHAALHGMTTRLDNLIAVAEADTMPELLSVRPDGIEVAAIESGQADNSADKVTLTRLVSGHDADKQADKVSAPVRTGFQSAVSVRTGGHADTVSGHAGGQADRRPDNLSGLVRELVSAGHDADKVRELVSAERPDSNPESVSRVIRREMRRHGA